jgi:hypothetical protein
MYEESFGNTDASGIGKACHAMPGILVVQVREKRNSLYLRAQEIAPLPEKGRLHMQTTHIGCVGGGLSAGSGGWVRIDRYLPMTLPTTSGVRSAVTLGQESHGCAVSSSLTES